NCADDEITQEIFGPNPADDEVQWLGDTVTNLWFESRVNIHQRQGATINMPDFLPSPGIQAGVGSHFTHTIGIGVTYTVLISPDTAQNELDSYLIEKLTVLDTENVSGRLYKGYASAEIYEWNLD